LGRGSLPLNLVHFDIWGDTIPGVKRRVAGGGLSLLLNGQTQISAGELTILWIDELDDPRKIKVSFAIRTSLYRLAPLFHRGVIL